MDAKDVDRLINMLIGMAAVMTVAVCMTAIVCAFIVR